MIKRTSGALIIEVLIAIVILASATLAIYVLIRTTQNNTIKSQFGSEMTTLAQNAVEISYDNIKNDWDTFPPGYYKTAFDSSLDKWSLIPSDANGETNLETKYTRVIQIKSVCRDSTTGEIIVADPCTGVTDPESKTIAVTVGWVNPSYGKSFDSNLMITKEK